MKNIWIIFLLLSSVFCFQSCVSTSSFQTARSMGSGEYGFAFGVNLPNYELQIDSTTSDFTGFMAEARGRYGITDRLDVGARLSIIGTTGADVKYQFLGDQNSTWAAAIGGEAGYARVEVNDSKNTIIDASIPVYLSVHPVPLVGIYVSPRYNFRSYGNGDNNSYIGAVGGLRIGKKGALFAEYAFLKSSDSDLGGDHTQVNVGFGYNIK